MCGRSELVWISNLQTHSVTWMPFRLWNIGIPETCAETCVQTSACLLASKGKRKVVSLFTDRKSLEIISVGN